MVVTGAALGIGELAAARRCALRFPNGDPGWVAGDGCSGWLCRWAGAKIGPKGPGMGRMMFGDKEVGT